MQIRDPILGFPEPEALSLYKQHGQSARIHTAMITVTPTTAIFFLSKSAGNRRLRRSTLDYWTGKMAKGKWETTHQGLAFNQRGEFVDGHHRMHAVINSQSSITMLVTFGLAAEAVLAIDSGVGRSMSDHAKFAGKNMSNSEVAILRIIIGGSGATRSGSGISPGEFLFYADRFRAALDFVFEACKACPPPAAIKAVMVRAFYSSDLDRLRDFFSVYHGGLRRDGACDERDSAALSLKRTLDVNRSLTKTRHEMYRRTQSALRCFLDRVPMFKIYGTEKENFPLPPDIESGLLRIRESWQINLGRLLGRSENNRPL